jgi:GT2 family glycosyltransferase
MSKVFIIILNWNGKKDSLSCLESVGKLKTRGFSLEVVVVDNASKDGSVGAFQKVKLTNAKLTILENSQNLGFAAGNNVGLQYALKNKADYVMVLNNDTLIDQSLVSELLKVAEENKKAGILSPKIYFAHGFEFHKKRYQTKDLGKVIWYAGGQIDWQNVYALNFGVDEVDRGQHNSVRKIDFATGACCLFRAQALRKAGLFDEKYFMYLEDVDLSLRIKNFGWQLLFVPQAFLWHKVSQSSGIGSNLNDYFITRNRLLFGMRYAQFYTKLVLIKESVRLLINGRLWQKIGVRDFYLRKFGKGSWR